MSNRAGVNGLMKPLQALSEAAQLLLGGRQPPGGGTVKVVLRPVRASPDCSTVVQESEVGDKMWMVFPATGLHFKTVSRDDPFAQPSKQHVGGLPPLRSGTRHT